MKKIIAILLAAVLLLGCAAAGTAEKTLVVFDDSLSLNVPAIEGHTMEVITVEGLVCIIFRPEGEEGTNYSTVIFPTDDPEYAAVGRLNDLTDEQLQLYIDSCIEEEMNDPVWEIRETGLGSKLLIVDEQGADHDYVYLYSVYEGYQICTYVDHIDGSEVTDEDIGTLLIFHTDLEFIR
ncbi:MAG: hypothetical protein Q4G19_03375 [Clostridia bacterium]|nr:hypothetical protein [Clostridia bacterium]